MAQEAIKGEKPGILLLGPFFDDLTHILQSKFTLFKLWEAEYEQAFLTQNAHKILGLVGDATTGAPAHLIHALPHLQIVACFSVGTDKVDVGKCHERGIVVTNTPDVLTDDTADLALALTFAAMRRVCAADRYVRDGLWPSCGCYPLSHKVSGKRLGILGLGRIGSAIAKRAQAFGCSISYYSRSKKSECPYEFCETVLELAKQCDILVLACALTPKTTHIVNREVLDALGPNGTLVNIARGAVVDEDELVKALVEHRLGAAGLDVFENEPHVPEELLGLDNVVLQPHVGSSTWETCRAMTRLVIANLEAHFAGKPTLTPVRAPPKCLVTLKTTNYHVFGASRLSVL